MVVSSSIPLPSAGAAALLVAILAGPAAADHGSAPYTNCAVMPPPDQALCLASQGAAWTLWAGILVAEYDWIDHSERMATCMAATHPPDWLECRTVR